jgi:hypothetical protein
MVRRAREMADRAMGAATPPEGLVYPEIHSL